MKMPRHAGLIALLTVALLLRIIYWSKGLLGGDSMGYAIGGLGAWTAHPPGFFGYCFLAWLVNQVLGNIIHSLVLINVTSSLLGIWFCHQLAESFGLRGRNALLATAAYAFSINLDYFSVATVSYPPEGMFATLFALLCRRAIVQQCTRQSLGATLVWALGGAFRQTTFTFLAPLWLYTMWKAGQLRRLPLHLLVALPLVWGWMHATQHYLAAYRGDLSADVSHDFWQLAMMMPSDHDTTKLGLDEDVKETSTTQYHMPFVEILTWIDEHTGTRFMPDYRDYNGPPPDLARAARLSLLQLGKLGFYLLFSLPCLLMVALLLPRLRKWKAWFKAGEMGFFLAWMLPVGCFFIVGHLGSFGYLQIFLSGFAVLVVLLLSRVDDSREPARWMNWQIIHAGFTAAALAFFLLARPFQSADPREKLLDVLVLQYTGKAIQNRYAVARSLTNKPGPPADQEWMWCRNDADILQWYSTTKDAPVHIYQPRAVR